jgi:hypothetical protein
MTTEDKIREQIKQTRTEKAETTAHDAAIVYPESQDAAKTPARDMPTGKFSHGKKGVNSGELGRKWGETFKGE